MYRPLPAQLGTFQVLDRLGGGGFSEVLLAKDLRPQNYGERVAIKRLRPGLIHRDPVFLDSLLSEAEVGMMVSNPHVVRVDCVLDDGGEPAVVMEFVDGYRLDRIIRTTAGHGLPAEAVAEIARQVSLGLTAIHEASDAGGSPLNVVHQDVKPANIIITPAGKVKLLDLGLARPQRSAREVLWVRQGTPGYRSPEQSAGVPVLTAASDLYALGVILYELLQGKPLFELNEGGPETLLERQRQLAINLELLASRVAPPGLDVILQKLLAFDLEERYGSAAEVVNDVVHWQKCWNSQLRLADYLERIQPRMEALPPETQEPEQIHCCDTQPGIHLPDDVDIEEYLEEEFIEELLPIGSGMEAVEPAPFEGFESHPGEMGSSKMQPPDALGPAGGAGHESSSAKRLLRRLAAPFGVR